MSRFFQILFMTFYIIAPVEARIRLRKVKEAPKVCAIMKEDAFLSRHEKKVFATLRHSILIESLTDETLVTLVRDKGEKICQWKISDWNSFQKSNNLTDLNKLNFYIDEYKEILYPYVQKEDATYLLMKIPFNSCSMSEQMAIEKLNSIKCENAKKKSRKKSKKKLK